MDKIGSQYVAFMSLVNMTTKWPQQLLLLRTHSNPKEVFWTTYLKINKSFLMPANLMYTSKSTWRAMGRTTDLKKKPYRIESRRFLLRFLCSLSCSQLFWMCSVCMVWSILFRRVPKASDISVVYFSHSLRHLHLEVTYPRCCINFEMFLKNQSNTTVE
jgi:hypothetical protein